MVPVNDRSFAVRLRYLQWRCAFEKCARKIVRFPEQWEKSVGRTWEHSGSVPASDAECHWQPVGTALCLIRPASLVGGRLLNLSQQPGLGKSPQPIRSTGRQFQKLSGFAQREPGEIAQLNQFAGCRVDCLKRLQRVIHRSQQVVIGIDRNIIQFDRDSLPVGAALLPIAVSSPVDQNSPHRLRGCPEEVPAPSPLLLVVDIHQSQPCLMHERRRLQRVVGRFTGHLRGRQPSQLRVNERQQFIRRSMFATTDCIQYLSDFGHDGENTVSKSDRTVRVNECVSRSRRDLKSVTTCKTTGRRAQLGADCSEYPARGVERIQWPTQVTSIDCSQCAEQKSHLMLNQQRHTGSSCVVSIRVILANTTDKALFGGQTANDYLWLQVPQAGGAVGRS